MKYCCPWLARKTVTTPEIKYDEDVEYERNRLQQQAQLRIGDNSARTVRDEINMMSDGITNESSLLVVEGLTKEYSTIFTRFNIGGSPKLAVDDMWLEVPVHQCFGSVTGIVVPNIFHTKYVPDIDLLDIFLSICYIVVIPDILTIIF